MDQVDEIEHLTPEENDNGAENHVEASIKSSETNSKEAENPVVASTDIPPDMNNGVPGNSVEDSAKSSAMNEAGVFGEKSTKSKPFRKRLVKSLKAKSVIKKKSSTKVASDANEVEDNPKIPHNAGAQNRLESSIDRPPEMNNGEPGNSVEDSAKSSAMNEAGVSGEKPTKEKPSRKRFVKSLKAKSGIKKKSSTKVALDADKVEGYPQIQHNAGAENRLESSVKETENPAVSSIGKPENPEEGADNHVEDSIESSEMNNKDANNVTGTSGDTPTKAGSSKKRFVKSLKAKSVMKKNSSSEVAADAKKVGGNLQTQQKNKKKHGRLSQGNKGGNKNDQDKNKNVNVTAENSEKDAAEKSQKIQDKVHRRSENNHDGKHKRPKGQSNEEKLDAKEDKKGDEEKKKKLGGLIFMCSAKTKPDCFRYQVMGVTSGKKDLVLGVRPGLNLFLYDFDLKLMYGVYKASSAGGMRLEPKAFGGSFPVQVRFSVHKDCIPLPESVFKKAIKDNYEGKKFNIELTNEQVRKLSALFRPVALQSLQPVSVPVHSLPRATPQNEEVERSRDSKPHQHKNFPLANLASNYPVRSHERERDNQPLQAPRDLFMSEKEYRTFGLQRDRRNLTPPRVVERELFLSRPNETLSRHRESDGIHPSYPASQSYNFSSATVSGSAATPLDSYSRDPYYSYPHNSSSRDSYLLPSRRDEVASGSYYGDGRRENYAAAVDPLSRRENDEMDLDKLYSKYSVEPPMDYTRSYQAKAAELPPVSSRYAFAGPSLSYR